MKLKVEGGGLYIHETSGVYRPVTQKKADKRYRDAYRKLFKVLNRWPPDGVYTFSKYGSMRPIEGSSLFMEYTTKKLRTPIMVAA